MFQVLFVHVRNFVILTELSRCELSQSLPELPLAGQPKTRLLQILPIARQKALEKVNMRVYIILSTEGAQIKAENLSKHGEKLVD